LDDHGTVRFFLSYRRNSRKLFDELYKNYRIDVINCHQPFSAYGVLQFPKSRSLKKIYTCHSLSFEEFVSRNPRPAGALKNLFYELKIFARKKIERRVIERSDNIVVLSRFTQDKLTTAYGIPPSKVSIIPGGVDLKRFRPVENKNAIRQALKLPDSKIILFTVRNLVARMGLENLIEAMQSVIRNASDIYLVIGGAGPLNGRLTKMAEQLGVNDCIRFEGFIPEETLPHYYQMADMFILPTKELEGFGLVTLEAMASGVPVLGTPVGGTKEILTQFDPTFLFKDTSPESMASIVLEKYHIIKNHPEKWQKISLECRRFAEENYSWDKHVNALEKYL